MLSTALRVAIPVLVFLFITVFTVSGFVSLPIALSFWALMIPVLAIALLWPRISPWLRRPTETPNESVLTAVQKHKAANDLLVNALEEGLSLKQGRRYTLKSENQDLDDI